MVFVIAEPCIDRCDGACMQVCPVDCIHGPVEPAELERLSPEERGGRVKGMQLYIDPSECIGCGACAPECPVDAIYDEDDLPEKWRHYAELNADWFARARKR
jgi:NAD-dependent dihydropyrimidine dehydrogenase PreA subunit